MSVHEMKVSVSGGSTPNISVNKRIQRAIIEKKKLDLTKEDAKEFYDEEHNDVWKAILEGALLEKVLSADMALQYLVKRIKNRFGSRDLSICLRMGADPNLYIHNHGWPGSSRPMHIMAYLYYRWKEVQPGPENITYLNTMVLALLHFGSNPLKNVFADVPVEKKEKPTDTKKEIEKVYIWSEGEAKETEVETSVFDLPPEQPQQRKELSVIQWLNDNGYPNKLADLYPSYRKVVEDVNTVNLMAVVTNTPQQVQGRLSKAYIEIGMDFRSIGINTGDGLLARSEKIDTMYGLDYTMVQHSVEKLSLVGLRYYLLMGYRMSYPMMNTLLLQVWSHGANGDVFISNLYARMVEDAVRIGTPLDTEQNLLLMKIDTRVRDAISKLYMRPFWEKECNGRRASASPRLQRVGAGLGIENYDSTEAVCSDLKKLAKMDPGELSRKLHDKEKQRLDLHRSPYEMGNSDVEMVCKRAITSEGDYMQYPSLQMTSYKDEADQVWCFPSYEYQNILNLKVNPHTDRRLPYSVVKEVEMKTKELQRLGVGTSKVNLREEALTTLNQSDYYNDVESERQKEKLTEMLRSRGVSLDEIMNLSPEELELAVRSGGYSFSNVNLLTPTHAYVTAAYIINYYMLTNKRGGEIMLNHIVASIEEKRYRKTNY